MAEGSRDAVRRDCRRSADAERVHPAKRSRVEEQCAIVAACDEEVPTVKREADEPARFDRRRPAEFGPVRRPPPDEHLGGIRPSAGGDLARHNRAAVGGEGHVSGRSAALRPHDTRVARRQIQKRERGPEPIAVSDGEFVAVRRSLLGRSPPRLRSELRGCQRQRLPVVVDLERRRRAQRVVALKPTCSAAATDLGARQWRVRAVVRFHAGRGRAARCFRR